MDVTDLESFGESSHNTKKEKGKNKSSNQTSRLPKDNAGLVKDTSMTAEIEGTSILKDVSLASSTSSKSDLECSSVNESAHTNLNSFFNEEPSSNTSTGGESSCTEHPPGKRQSNSSLISLDHGVDSDEERLVIDDADCQHNRKCKLKTQEQSLSTDSVHLSTSTLREHSSDPNVITSPSSITKDTQKGTKRPRNSKTCDQLGNILRMQDAMLKFGSKGQELTKTLTSEVQSPEVKPNTYTLVKPSVSAYLDSKEGLPNEPATLNSSQPSTQRKS